jgi:type VI secretion system protein
MLSCSTACDPLQTDIYCRRVKARIVKDLQQLAFRLKGCSLRYTWARAARLVFLTTVVLLATSSCGIKKSIGTRTKKLFGGEFTVSVHVAPNANMNNPVAVEFLIVYDEKLAETLAKTSAKDWFMNRTQFRQDNPKGFDSWYWEWIPGQQVMEEKIPLKPGARTNFVFANYVTPGDNRAKFDPNKNVAITLNEKSFTATPE